MVFLLCILDTLKHHIFFIFDLPPPYTLCMFYQVCCSPCSIYPSDPALVVKTILPSSLSKHDSNFFSSLLLYILHYSSRSEHLRYIGCQQCYCQWKYTLRPVKPCPHFCLFVSLSRSLDNLARDEHNFIVQSINKYGLFRSNCI